MQPDALCLLPVLPRSHSALCCAVGLLDLEPEGILQQVAQRLCGKSLRQLRSTCSLLWRSDSLLLAVTKAALVEPPFSPVWHMPFLLRLTSLCRLTVRGSSSLWYLTPLSSITGLQELRISTSVPLDMAPLLAISQLRTLVLSSSCQVLNLQDLVHITQLRIWAHATFHPPLNQMTWLKSLHRFLCPPDLSMLSRLTKVKLSHDVVHSEAQVAAAVKSMRQLPALSVVYAETRLLVPPLDLAHITALHLSLSDRAQPLSISGLPGLQRLGLVHSLPWDFSISSLSLRLVQLEAHQGDVGKSTPLPSLACPSLQHLVLLPHDSAVSVTCAQLPAQQVRISALVGEAGQVLAQCGVPASRFTLQFYDHTMLQEWSAQVPSFQ